MHHRAGQSGPVLLVLVIGCCVGMWFFHRQSHAPAPAASRVAAAPPEPAVPEPRIPIPTEVAPGVVEPPQRVVSPPSSPPPEPPLPPPPVYTGMLQMNGQPLAVIEGRGGSFKLGDQVQGGTITAITPVGLTLRYGTRSRMVPIDTNPARHVGPPPMPSPPPRRPVAWPSPEHRLIGGVPQPPPLPANYDGKTPVFVPVTPPPLPAGSGSSRD